MQKIKVTIVLLIKNNAEVLEELLTAIFSQEASFSFEVLAIDSGSFDGSLAILKRFKYRLENKKRGHNNYKYYKNYNHYKEKRTLRICQIAPIEFGFGKMRNLASRLARGEIVVFISTRTIPSDRQWLSNLVESLTPFTRIDSGVVASFGKVIPGPNISFSEAFRLRLFYGRPSKILSIDKNKEDRENKGDRGDTLASLGKTNFSLLFSDLNGAILRSVLRKYPMPENIIGGEEQVWAKMILEKGMAIAYNPHAGVVLRRGHTFGEIFRYYFNKGYTLAKSVSVSGLAVFWPWAGFLFSEIIYLIKKQNLKIMVKEFIFEMGRLLGYLLGQRADRLPGGMRERWLNKQISQ